MIISGVASSYSALPSATEDQLETWADSDLYNSLYVTGPAKTGHVGT